jgi:cyclophilin family peptidyl-prolyl cis-trans isomerase
MMSPVHLVSRLLLLVHLASSYSVSNNGNRRVFLSDLAQTAAATAVPAAVLADEDAPVGATVQPAAEPSAESSSSSSKPPSIGQKVLIKSNVQMSAEETLRRSFVVGLYSSAAPEASRVFSSLAAGTLKAPCQLDNSGTENLARSALTKKSVYRACLAGAEEPVSYDNSLVWRILKDRRVDFGQVAGRYAYRIAPATPASESAALSHDRAGLISVPKQGGSFDFSITLAATPELDATNKVIGEVLEGLDTVRLIGDLPVVSYAGQGNGAESSRAKQCFYGSPDTFCSQLKPIKKVSISSSLL